MVISVTSWECGINKLKGNGQTWIFSTKAKPIFTTYFTEACFWLRCNDKWPLCLFPKRQKRYIWSSTIIFKTTARKSLCNSWLLVQADWDIGWSPRRSAWQRASAYFYNDLRTSKWNMFYLVYGLPPAMNVHQWSCEYVCVQTINKMRRINPMWFSHMLLVQWNTKQF